MCRRRLLRRVPEAESRAWNSFYHSGSVEDYIRYAQLRHRRDSGAGSHTAGARMQIKTQGLIIKEQTIGESDRSSRC